MISITDISISSISTLKLSLNRYMGIYGKPVNVLGGRTKQQWNDVYNYSTYVCIIYELKLISNKLNYALETTN